MMTDWDVDHDDGVWADVFWAVLRLFCWWK